MEIVIEMLQRSAICEMSHTNSLSLLSIDSSYQIKVPKHWGSFFSRAKVKALINALMHCESVFKNY